MDLAARTQYLKEVRELTVRCQTKLESLVSSIGWSWDSLNKSVTDSSICNEAEAPGTASQPTTHQGNPQLEDFEKRYNDLLSGLPTHQKKDQQKSEAEALAELLEFERNSKRRRISYKNKVHTKNKSHTEVLRELVREQMEVLKEISGDVTKEEKAVEKPVETEEDGVGLIQISFAKGNPYKMWQRVGQMVENRGPDERRPSRSDDVDREGHRRYSKDRRSKPYDQDDRSSWRYHDDRDKHSSKDRWKDRSDGRSSKNRNDYGGHRHKSRKRSRSPQSARTWES